MKITKNRYNFIRVLHYFQLKKLKPGVNSILTCRLLKTIHLLNDFHEFIKFYMKLIGFLSIKVDLLSFSMP
jgi:hypothetical protein